MPRRGPRASAAEFGLDVAVDLLQGHVSSFDFLPSWVLTWHQRSAVTDDEVRAGLANYLATVGTAVSTRPNVSALTLGNEINKHPAAPSTAPGSPSASTVPPPSCRPTWPTTTSTCAPGE